MIVAIGLSPFVLLASSLLLGFTKVTEAKMQRMHVLALTIVIKYITTVHSVKANRAVPYVVKRVLDFLKKVCFFRKITLAF